MNSSVKFTNQRVNHSHYLFHLSYLLLFLGLLLSAELYAFESFVIKDIRLEGLRRISAGTVFNYLPIKVGDTLDETRSQEAIVALFKTGLFKNIGLAKDNQVLVVRLEERPAIAKIKFEGNSEIETKQLTEALKQTGFAEGRVFDKSLLDKVELELQRQYFNLGKYAVKIKTTVTPMPRNRVGIQFDISEGVAARIHAISIVGNQSISDSDLLDEIKLSTSGWFSWITKSDQYSKQKLAADLETLRAYYMDRGFVNFAIDSTQVAISPDKKDIYLSLNLTEGDKYTISDIKLVGNLIVSEAELREKLTFKVGDVFSRKEITASSEAMVKRLGNEGYFFAHANPVPEVDNAKKTVSLTFYVDPGKRIYVRRINFIGNLKTRDDVLRRELRQMEGSWVSAEKLERSRVRMVRLNYFDDVQMETPDCAEYCGSN
ncbi:MAG: outer membrane protein assembly factor BamA [Thiotrichaceae bacterium]